MCVHTPWLSPQYPDPDPDGHGGRFGGHYVQEQGLIKRSQAFRHGFFAMPKILAPLFELKMENE